MPDEAPTSPADTQAPPSEPVSAPEPVSEAPAEPPPEAAPAPESESLSQSEIETGKPTPTETPASAEVSESAPEPVSESQAPATQPEPSQTTYPSPATASAVAPTSIIGELLVKARAKIQDRRKKKLERIMTKLSETGKITNDEVQKLLRVSDATATRYLDTLEKEGRLRQEGKTGKHVVYIKI